MLFDLTRFAEGYGSLDDYEQSVVIGDLEDETENGLFDKLSIKD